MPKKYLLNISVHIQAEGEPDETRNASMPIAVMADNENINGFCGEVATTMAMLWQSFQESEQGKEFAPRDIAHNVPHRPDERLH